MPEFVELWVVPLDRDDAEIQRLRGMLSREERERAGEGRALRKRRYVARQAALRSIIAERAGAAPGDVRFTRSAQGKPAIAGGEGVEFSVSDSAGLALVALAKRAVGVDVEQVRDRPAARRAGLGTDLFFEHWTRTEATGKATGAGLLATGAGARVTCTSLDVGPGYAAAVALVGADEIQIRLRPY